MQALDWCMLAGYATLVLTIGWFVSRGTHSAEGHLRANRDLPAWAVVFSILAAEVSAATYIGVPESAFRGNWTYLQFAIGALIGKWVLSHWFVRRFWRLNLPTVYGFLGQRLGPRTQVASAWAFLAGRMIASGVRLFIAALAFAVVTGLQVETVIVIMALISTGYTFVGGLKAVVWTDVAQGTLFFVGASTALVVGLLKLDLPISQVVSEAAQAGKLQLFDTSSNPFTSTQSLWGALVGGFFLVLASHGTDQENVQHMLNTRSEKSSGRTVFTSGFAAFPIVALFLSVGTMLWVYHRHRTPSGYGFATNEEIKRIFPNFIMHELPVGVRGLVFAGLFAAAISSLGATLNAATAAWTNDIAPRPAERPVSLVSVRILIFVFGIVLALVGLFFAWFARDAQSDLVQIALSAMTILYGAILGTFLLALFVERRGSDRSALAGLVAGVAVGAVLFFQRQIFGLEHEFLAWPWRLPLAAGIAVLIGLCGRRRARAI